MAWHMVVWLPMCPYLPKQWVTWFGHTPVWLPMCLIRPGTRSYGLNAQTLSHTAWAHVRVLVRVTLIHKRWVTRLGHKPIWPLQFIFLTHDLAYAYVAHPCVSNQKIVSYMIHHMTFHTVMWHRKLNFRWPKTVRNYRFRYPPITTIMQKQSWDS